MPSKEVGDRVSIDGNHNCKDQKNEAEDTALADAAAQEKVYLFSKGMLADVISRFFSKGQQDSKANSGYQTSSCYHIFITTISLATIQHLHRVLAVLNIL
jgi:hypothetical protein